MNSKDEAWLRSVKQNKKLDAQEILIGMVMEKMGNIPIEDRKKHFEKMLPALKNARKDLAGFKKKLDV